MQVHASNWKIAEALERNICKEYLQNKGCFKCGGGVEGVCNSEIIRILINGGDANFLRLWGA